MNETGVGRDAPEADKRERALLASVARGDRRAFERLYGEYYPRVTRFLAKLINSRDVIEEAYNDVMLTVWQKAAGFQGESKVSTWIFGIAYYKGIKSGKRLHRHMSAPLAEEEVDASPGPEDECNRLSVQRQLWGELNKLPLEQRAVVELTFYNDFSYREISRIIDVPVNTVKTRMFHARQKLRRTLRRAEA